MRWIITALFILALMAIPTLTKGDVLEGIGYATIYLLWNIYVLVYDILQELKK